MLSAADDHQVVLLTEGAEAPSMPGIRHMMHYQDEPEVDDDDDFATFQHFNNPGM